MPTPIPDAEGDEAEFGAEYYETIQSHFLEKRGSPLFISPKEWAIIRRWEELGIPTEVVCAGVDEVFSRPKAYDAPRKLGYCRQTVEARFRRYCEARLGVVATGSEQAEQAGDSERGSQTREPQTAPAYLASLAERLETIAEFHRSGHPEFARALIDGAAAVATMGRAVAERGDDVETELKRLESELVGAAEAVFSEESPALLAQAEQALAAYRGRMPDDVHHAAVQSGYRRRLRRLAGIPTLSLFDR